MNLTGSMLTLAVTLTFAITLVAGGSPTPGVRCSDPEDCAPSTTRMVCEGNDSDKKCACGGFRANDSKKVTVTQPYFDLKERKCVVKEGDHCEVKVRGKLLVDCQASATCTVKEGETEIGICTKSGAGQGHGNSAANRSVLYLAFFGAILALFKN